MSLRVGAVVRQAPGRTVKALGQQVAQLQGPDMAQRLQAEMALYRLNKHLRYTHTHAMAMPRMLYVRLHFPLGPYQPACLPTWSRPHKRLR